MNPPPDLLPGLPPAIAAEAWGQRPDVELARRILHAPRPGLDFESAAARAGIDPDEKVLTALRTPLLGPVDPFRSPDQPFFAAPGTSGTLRSPDPALPDDFWWLLVAARHGDEAAAWRHVTTPWPALGGRTLLDRVRAWQAPGPAGWWARFRLGGDWRAWVYELEMRAILGQFG